MRDELEMNNETFAQVKDFKYLRQFAMESIQELSGSAWTNLNPSDPGVTILEQACYALTELGYCSSFPIEDILTESGNRIRFLDQFYKPDEIFERTPVTISELRHYIKKISKDILSVGCIILDSEGYYSRGTYLFKLCVIPDLKDVADLQKEVYFELNKVRGLGEMFTLPDVVPTINYRLQGTLVLESASPDLLFVQVLNKACQNLIVLKWEELSDSVISVRKETCTKISVYDFSTCTNDINEIQNLRDLSIIQPDGSHTDYIEICVNKFATLDIVGSINSKSLKVVFNNRNLDLTSDSISAIKDELFDKVVINYPNYGSYRDISSYYSIQETFPALYKVGSNSSEQAQSNYEIAISRQLRGYLLMIDQIISNEFAQLSNVPELFSFNVLNVANSEVLNNYLDGVRNRKFLSYPAPELYFTPTYYYNTLYKVPYVGPLLKHYNQFEQEVSGLSSPIIEKLAFEKYIADPYNPYNQALMTGSATQKNNIERKNEIINHLLARHGIAPTLIDNMTNDSVYTGVELEDKLLVKSSLLRNFGRLSCRRNCAANFLAALKLQETSPDEKPLLHNEPHEKYVIDSIFNPEEFYRELSISKQDLIDYSTLELYGWLLLGLKPIYDLAIFDSTNKDQRSAEKERLKQLKWFSQERKGFIFIEQILLQTLCYYKIELWSSVPDKPEFIIRPELTNDEYVQFQSMAFQSEDWLDAIQFAGRFTLNGKEFSVVPNLSDTSIPFYSNNCKWRYNTAVLFGDKEVASGKLTTYEQTVFLIFPNYIPLLQSKEFINRLDCFLNEFLPVQLSPKLIYLSQIELDTFVPLFVQWHNLLRWNPVTDENSDYRKKVVSEFYEQLQKIADYV